MSAHSLRFISNMLLGNCAQEAHDLEKFDTNICININSDADGTVASTKKVAIILLLLLLTSTTLFILLRIPAN